MMVVIYPDLVIESDAIEIVRSVTKESYDLIEMNNLTELVRDLLLKANVVTILHCPRSANNVAHSLARATTRFFEFLCSSLPLLRGERIESFVPLWLSSALGADLCVMDNG